MADTTTSSATPNTKDNSGGTGTDANNNNNKTLPSLPRSLPSYSSTNTNTNRPTTRLNVTAREHRGKLVRHWIREVVSLPELEGDEDDFEYDGFGDGDRDRDREKRKKEEWACALEGALDELGECVGRGGWVSGGKERKSVLLCLAPSLDYASGKVKAELPKEDLGFDIIADTSFKRPVVAFRVGVFVSAPSPSQSALSPNAAVSMTDDPFGDNGILDGGVLFRSPPSYPSSGEDENTNTKLVGGTFVLQNTPSPSTHIQLSYVLRLGIYTHLSLLREQLLLLDFGVPLVIPRYTPIQPLPLPLSPTSPPVPMSPSPTNTNSKVGTGSVGSGVRQGLFSLWNSAKKAATSTHAHSHSLSQNLRHRLQSPPVPASARSVPAGVASGIGRIGGSLDLSMVSLTGHERESSSVATSTTATDSGIEGPGPGAGRRRRFSLLTSSDRPSVTSSSTTTALSSRTTSSLPSHQRDPAKTKHMTLPALLARLQEEADAGLLSASPGVSRRVGVPRLVEQLALRDSVSAGNGDGTVRGNGRGGKAKKRKLLADERVALSSVLGYDGNTGTRRGEGMLGVRGFVGMLGVEVCVVEYLKDGEGKEGEKGKGRMCGRPRYLSWRYFEYADGEEGADGEGKEGSGETEEETEEEWSGSGMSGAEDTDTDTDTSTMAGSLAPPSTRRRRRRRTKTHHASGGGGDRSLGQFLREIVNEAGQTCANASPGACLGRRGLSTRKAGASARVRRARESEEDGGGGGGDSASVVSGKTAGSTSTADSGTGTSVGSTPNASPRKVRKSKDGGTGGGEKGQGGCERRREEHEVWIVNGGFGVVVSVSLSDEGDDEKGEDGPGEGEEEVDVWSSCKRCGYVSEKRRCSGSTLKYSLAKFVELMMYSPYLEGTEGMEHSCSDEGRDEGGEKEEEKTTPQERASVLTVRPGMVESSSSADMRKEKEKERKMKIRRHFSLRPHSRPRAGSTEVEEGEGRKEGNGKRTVTFRVESVGDVYEVHVPGSARASVVDPVASRSASFAIEGTTGGEGKTGAGVSEDKKVLRREIKRWWEGVGDYLDRVEETLLTRGESEDKVGDMVTNMDNDVKKRKKVKALPRLPSVDDAYFSSSGDDSDSETGTPTPKFSDALPTPGLGISGLPAGSSPPSSPAYPGLSHGGGGQRKRDVARGYLAKIKGAAAASPLGFGGGGGGEYFPNVPVPGLGMGRGPRVPEKDSNLRPPSAYRGSAVSRGVGSASTPNLVLPPTDHVELAPQKSADDMDMSTPRPSKSESEVDDVNPEILLSALRESFHRLEQALYVQLGKTAEEELNDVRRAFMCCARGVERRVGMWERKHGVDKERVAASSGFLASGSEGEKTKVRFGEEGKEPEWWKRGAHVPPGGNVVVREDDWGSVIAYTMGSREYLRELAGMGMGSTSTSGQVASSASAPQTPRSEAILTPTAITAPNTASSSTFFGAASNYRFFPGPGSSNAATSSMQPDPDNDDTVWYDLEPFSAVVSRKEHPKDPTSLLSIREVLRQKSPSAAEVSLSNRFASLSSASSSTSRNGSGSTGGSILSVGSVLGGGEGARERGLSQLHPHPPSAYSKPAVQVSTQAVGGELGIGLPSSSAGGNGSGRDEAGRDGTSAAGKMLHQIESTGTTSTTASWQHVDPVQQQQQQHSRTTSAMTGTGSEYSGHSATATAASSLSGLSSIRFDARVKRKSSGSGSFSSESEESSSAESDSTEKGATQEGSAESAGMKAPMPALKLHIPSPTTPTAGNSRKEVSMSDIVSSSSPQQQPNTKSSFANLANGFTNAMRFVLTAGAESPGRSPSPGSLAPSAAVMKNHHALLSAESLVIDERPHIKYDWTIGKRLKFSCTVYYAKQFDSLRKKCGLADTTADGGFLKSLRQSANWSAEGGKSRSNFWKSWDDRFIIKTLVNAWNVADLQVLIELGPSYFRYIESTSTKPSALAKLLGFYTVEIRNLETGAVQSRADLLVMENLFYRQKVSKTFDFKGIQGRRVKAKNEKEKEGKTLFDGDWIEGQRSSLTFIQPHSKVVLREALRNDADFLAKNNIMDYSLLLGIDRENQRMSCGLVDTIGSYTFAKTLEYKAKQGLNAGKDKEVTVIPPNEYQDRFVKSLDGYFFPCPDKWTKPQDDRMTSYDLSFLPSML